MQLKIITSLSGPELSLVPGDTHDFADEAEALRLIAAGFAIAAEPEKAPAQKKPAPAAKPATKAPAA